jgi:O-antigen/teichoic acid export membrane protein
MLPNALGLVGSKLATLGLGYLAWIVAARLWPASDVGLAAAAVSAMMLCVQLGLIGAGSAVISHFPEYKTRPADLLDPAITVVIGASLAIAVVFLGVAAVGLSHLASIAHSPAEVLLFVALCVTGTLGVLLDQLSVALRRTDQAVVRGTASGIVTLALLGPAAILWRHDGTLAILAAWTVGGIIPCLIGVVQVRRSVPGYRFQPRFAGLGPLIATGLPNFALTVAERAPGPILPIIATEALSPTSNAYWYSAWMVAWVVYWIPISVGMTLFAEASHTPDELSDHVRKARMHALMLGCGSALVVAALAHPILALLGHGYAAHGTWALRILTLAVVPGTFIQLYFGACRARRALKEGIIVGTSAGLIGLAAAAALGTRFGLVGMASGWVATQSVAGAFAFARLRQVKPAAGTARPADKRTDLTQGPYRYLWLRVSRAPAGRGGLSSQRVCATVIGLDRDGYLTPLVLREMAASTAKSWRDLFAALVRRGLEPPALVIADAIPGLDDALAEFFPGVARQRCLPSLLRQLEGHVPPSERPALRASMRAVVAQPDAAAARQQLMRMRRELRRRWPAVAVILNDVPTGQLTAFTSHPRASWSRIASTKVIASITPDGSSRSHVQRALREAASRWEGRRYLLVPTAPAVAAAIEPVVVAAEASPSQLSIWLEPLSAALSWTIEHWREWALLPPAAGLWIIGVQAIDTSRMNDLGLVSVIPAPALIALGLLAISFTIALRRGASEGMLAFHVILTVVALSAIAPLAEHQPRFDVTYRHLGIADAIARSGTIDPHFDAYFNWPGFFALSAALTRAIGASSPLVVTEWAPLVLGLAYLAPLVIIFRRATRDRRLVWLAAWFFTVANWIGQDYWSPQGLAFFLMLAALAGCLLVLRREQATASRPIATALAFIPRLAGPVAPVVRRFFHSDSTAPRPRTRAPSSITTRVGVFFVVLLISAAVIAGHQLTPFALLAVMVGLVITGRLSTRALPVILFVAILVWLVFPASSYVDGHLQTLTGQVGNVGGAVGANLTGRLGGSKLHKLVVQERLLFAGGVWALAMIGALRRIRAGHRDADLAVIALAPFPLLPLQPYGGEMLLRVYMFALPGVAFFAAAALLPSHRLRRAWFTHAVLAAIAVALTGAFLVARYGNERADAFTNDEVAVVHQLYAAAPTQSLLVAATVDLPWKYTRYNDYRYNLVDELPAFTQHELTPAASWTPVIGAIREVMHARGKHGAYLILTRSQQAFGEQRGELRPGDMWRLAAAVRRQSDFRTVYRNQDGVVFKYVPGAGR